MTLLLRRLVDATAEIYDRVDDSNPDRYRHRLVEAAHIGCRTLDRVLLDPRVDEALRLPGAARAHDEVMENVRRLQESAGEFLDVERRVLVQAGMREDVVDRLLGECEELLHEDRETEPSDALIRSLGELRDLACRVARDAEAVEDGQRFGRRLWYGIGGCAVALANGAVTPLAPAVGVVSTLIAGGLIGRSMS
ncbi:hypothetical protein [Rubrivirga sp. IMCC43871]|uniref:hypothetical protein n=1 Tax=Rubrivirga sp. IMCC43871 TaxID=3391575 RepID=UPI00398FC4D6